MASIVITGGGTGGHVYPGLAVYDALPEALQRRVIWVGSRHGVERGLVAARGIPYRAIPTGKLRRYFDLQNVSDLFRVGAGILAAWRCLRRVDGEVVFSKGGFVAVPVVVAAYLRGIPVIIHESDSDPGLATRLTASLADRVFVSGEEAAGFGSPAVRSRIRVSGNPVRRAFRTAGPAGALEMIGLEDTGLPLVLVTGGSLGAMQLNGLLREVIGALTEEAVVVHQSGEQGQSIIPEIRARARRGRYFGAAGFTDEFPPLMRRATVVVARAGAGTIREIAVCGRAAVLVPLSAGASRGDQIRNAERYARSGAATVLADPDLDGPRFLDAIMAVLRDGARRAAMESAAMQFAGGDAAAVIADSIVEADRIAAEERSPEGLATRAVRRRRRAVRL